MTRGALLGKEGVDARRRTTDVEIVIPVYNEEQDLERSLRRLHCYLTEGFPLRWTVTIADNASRDRTWGIACRLATELDGVRAVHLDERGRGRALRAVWSASAASVVAYMDVDLSTDLNALFPLVAPLLSGHSDVAIGSRLAHGARVVRGPKREVISRCYNLILKATMHSGFSDAQCGFKAVQWQRSEPDPGSVRAVRGTRQNPLLHCWARRGGWAEHSRLGIQPDQPLGAEQLFLNHCGWNDVIRPHPTHIAIKKQQTRHRRSRTCARACQFR